MTPNSETEIHVLPWDASHTMNNTRYFTMISSMNLDRHRLSKALLDAGVRGCDCRWMLYFGDSEPPFSCLYEGVVSSNAHD